MGRTDQKNTAGKKQVSVIAQGGAAAFAVGLLLILLASVLTSKGLLRSDAAVELSVAACALGGFFASLFTVGRLRGNSFVHGLAVGGMELLLFLLLGCLTIEGMAPGAQQLPLWAGCLCSGGLAGLLSKKGKKRKRV